MTAPIPATIPASIATACAAHDRHRLDVLDALLDEAAPSAVRELLGAALDLCASLRAERDEMTAQFDEFRRDVSSGIAVAAQTHADEVSALRAAVDRYDSEATAVRNALRSAGVPDVAPYPPDEAIDDYERSLRSGGRALQPVERIGMLAAALASERAHLAACQARIAGLEQAADERIAEVARVDALFEEARGALVDVATALNVVVGVASPDVASRCRAEVARLAARVAELEARPVLTVERLTEAWCCAGAEIGTPNRSYVADLAGRAMRHLGPVTLPAQDRADELARAIDRAAEEGSTIWSDATRRDRADITRAALASLGAPPTSPPAAIDADALYARCERDFMGGYSGPLYDAFKHGMWTVCNVLRSTKPASPPAARPVFAGVSASDLLAAYGDGYNHPSKWITIDDAKDCNGNRLAGLRAVLARLDATLVAPEFLRRIPLYTKHGPNGKGDPGPCDATCVKCEAERIVARPAAAGIPVTPAPEVAK